MNIFESDRNYTTWITITAEDIKVDNKYFIDDHTECMVNGKTPEVEEAADSNCIITVSFKTSNKDDSSSSEPTESFSVPDDSSTREKPWGILGDVNGDGNIDIEDAVAIISHVNGTKTII